MVIYILARNIRRHCSYKLFFLNGRVINNEIVIRKKELCTFIIDGQEYGCHGDMGRAMSKYIGKKDFILAIRYLGADADSDYDRRYYYIEKLISVECKKLF